MLTYYDAWIKLFSLIIKKVFSKSVSGVIMVLTDTVRKE